MLYHLSKDKITPYNQFWEKIWDTRNKIDILDTSKT
jgi:hypothetical protein